MKKIKEIKLNLYRNIEYYDIFIKELFEWIYRKIFLTIIGNVLR